MKVEVSTVYGGHGEVRVRFIPETPEERVLAAESVQHAKAKEHDGPFALSKLLIDLTDRRAFDFSVTGEAAVHFKIVQRDHPERAYDGDGGWVGAKGLAMLYEDREAARIASEDLALQGEVVDVVTA